MKKYIKFLCLTLILVVICNFIVACRSDKTTDIKEGKIYDNAQSFLHDEYLQSNATRGPSDSDELPMEITNIIRTQDELNAIAQSENIDINFEKEILVLYFFTDFYSGFGCVLSDLKVEDRVLKITVLHKLAPKRPDGLRPPSTSQPTQRCIAVKTILTDFDSVNIMIDYED